MTTVEILNGVFRQVFDDDSIEVTPELTADEVEGWDSLSHVNLILAVETTFKIRFATKEVLAFRNVGDMIGCIEGKLTQ